MESRDRCASCARGGRVRIYRMGGRTVRADYRVALAGNPNTGKSTLFNALTGLNQRTGNWPGKTVSTMEGAFRYGQHKYELVDLPGTYSLLSTSEDEEIARNYILFEEPDVTVVVADASRLERNLNLVLQIASISSRCVLCVNLLDEARRNRVEVDLRMLSEELGLPVVGTSAASGEGLAELLDAIERVACGVEEGAGARTLALPHREGAALARVVSLLRSLCPTLPSREWVGMRLLDSDASVEAYMRGHADRFCSGVGGGGGSDPYADLMSTVEPLRASVGSALQTAVTQALYAQAHAICGRCVREGYAHGRSPVDRRIDRLVTSRAWGFPIMLLLLAGVLWLTILGANVPSSLLDDLLVQWLHPLLRDLGVWVGMPWWVSGFLFDGVYLSTAWVVSVMLPPMAIFFPLFTLLEDLGYLPRVAFNLDELFRRSGAHGKQALTMAMGFGCNAAGIVAARIIDSPRERLIAVLTNNFSLCNGRWPTQIMVATLFVGASVPSAWQGVVSMVVVVGVALLGVVAMFLMSWVLSRTLLRGEVSTFHLELPPYRRPQVLQVLYTSLIDRTLRVLWRAIVFAAPAGGLIWLSSNVDVCGEPIARHLIGWLEGPGVLMGLNGVILLAYVLAVPANEIVLPTILMLIVLATGMEGVGAGAGVLFESELGLAELLAANGWTLLTGVSLMLFCLLHNPCSTAIYTMYKETKSVRWTLVGSLLPVVLGVVVCICVAAVWRAIEALV